jgi:hypothetical protein
MRDISIVIPHHGDTFGLWTTVNTCEAELSGSPHDYEYVIVTNGQKITQDLKLFTRFLSLTGRMIHIHTEERLTPPAARSRGVEASSGRLLFFFDNHCIPCRRYFDRAVADFAKYNMAQLHSGTKFFVGDMTHYHYKLLLEDRFWGCTGHLIPSESTPYKIAAAGHGGFAIRRDVWDAVGGYGPDSLYEDYGGEEFNLDLKLWRMGYDNWMDPKLVHDHWAGLRPYTRHYTDLYYVNFLTSAFVIGGEKWLNKVYESFAKNPHMRVGPKKPMFDLLQDAYKRGYDYAKELDAKCKYTLDEVLARFRTELVAYE